MGLSREDQKSFRTRFVLLALISFVSVVFAILVLVIQNYRIVEKGQLLPYTDGEIYKVILFDQLVIYAEPEATLTTDLMNAYLMTGVGFVGLLFAIVILSYHYRTWNPEIRFFFLIFFGMSYLAADEALGIHETIGHNFQFLKKIPLIERPDDFVVALYLVPILFFVFIFRRIIFADPIVLLLMNVAVASAVIGGIFDIFSWKGEEVFEFIATLCLLVSVTRIGIRGLPEWVRTDTTIDRMGE